MPRHRPEGASSLSVRKVRKITMGAGFSQACRRFTRRGPRVPIGHVFAVTPTNTWALVLRASQSKSPEGKQADMATMKAVVFKKKNQIAIEEVPKPSPRAGEAVIRITATTICGTDVHIVRGEYPVKPGLTLGHEPVGVIEELGAGLEELYTVGERVIVGAITPCGQCFYCLNGAHSQCGGGMGGWRFGNTINGAWAEYLLVPDARANLAPIPDALSDEDVLLCPDIFSTGLSGAESGNIRVGDAVAVFAQGPIGLCATLGAKLKGAPSSSESTRTASASRSRAGSAPMSR